MDQNKNIFKGLKKFYRSVNKKFCIERIILFGSMATKKYNKYSDIDLMIVSDDFEGITFFERASKMYDYWDLDYPVDFLCYTTSEFNYLKKKISIVKEALDNGIQITV